MYIGGRRGDWSVREGPERSQEMGMGGWGGGGRVLVRLGVRGRMECRDTL